MFDLHFENVLSKNPIILHLLPNFLIIRMKLFLASLFLCLAHGLGSASYTNDIELKIGDKLDSYNGVVVYYNGKDFSYSDGRSLSKDGYNYGLKYQCIEFVKRYYHQVYKHKMPNTFGHAKDFFQKGLSDEVFNKSRGLTQFTNVRNDKPKVGDILVYDAYEGNPYGHVAIVCNVGEDEIEIIQQNMKTSSRKKIKLVKFLDIYTVADYNVLGWLGIRK